MTRDRRDDRAKDGRGVDGRGGDAAPHWHEDDIAASVDGAIEDPAEVERIARLIATDPDAAALATRIEASNRDLREAFDAPMHQEIPPAIAAVLGAPPGAAPGALRGAAPGAEPATAAGGAPERAPDTAQRVVPLHRPPRRAWQPMALAASLALAVGLGAGMALMQGDVAGDGTRLALGPQDSSDPLATVLETAASGEATAAIRPLLTFRDAAGRPCREFETVTGGGLSSGTGIACRSEAGIWSVRILVATSAPGGDDTPDGFRPAAGAAADALGATLDAIGAGPALSPDAEAALIRRRWSPAD